MAFLLSAASSVSIDFGGDDDLVDKLSRQYSVVLLVVFCVVVSTRQYVGDPIHCWVPGTFTAAMRDYTDNMCWIRNTYYIPTDQDIPKKDEDIKTELNYYQWVPIMLALQALMFYVPHMMWRALNNRIGCDLKNLVKLLTDASMLNQEVHEKTIRFSTSHIDRFLVSRMRKIKRGDGKYAATVSSSCAGRRSGNRIVATYALIKLLYLSNAVGQLFMLNVFIGKNYDMYGLQVLGDLINGRETSESPRFPRSTLCSFKVREFGGNTHRHTVQCVLPVNLFNEKIYIFLWFWLILVAALTMCSLIAWMWTITVQSRVALCRRYLKRVPSETFVYGQRDRPIVFRFAGAYLGQDGAFIIRLLAKNVNSVVISEIVLALYENYQKLHARLDDSDDGGGGGGDAVDYKARREPV